MPKVFLRTSKRFKLFACNSFGSAKLCFFISFLLFSFCVVPSSFANNLSVSNATLVDQSSGSDTVDIQFDVSWENSWRDATNYDAVWVFAKYCTENCSTTGTWSHATLKTSGTNPAGFSRGSGTSLDVLVPTDKKGAFLQRSANGTGTVTTNNVELVWDYGADGVSDVDAVAANTRVRVFGIEMVYVPQGAFYAGDAASNGAFDFNQTNTPWLLTNEEGFGAGYYSGADSVHSFSDWFWYVSNGQDGEDPTGAEFLLPAVFPKGFKAFYMMKYEITQGQYRDFLNCLTRAEQANRVAADISGAVMSVYLMSGVDAVTYRNGLRTSGDGGSTNRLVVGCDLNANGVLDEANDGEWIAMNYMTWMDLCAYLDWSALRPMTELEFEKAGRGTEASVAGEFAWGTTNITQVNSLFDSGKSSEVAGNADKGLCAHGDHAAVQGPLRSGFAATNITTREMSGASYYGGMALSGNAWERAVTVGNAVGRSFQGTHGDGALGTAACATNEDWPGWSGGQVKDAWGCGLRGGSFADGAPLQRTSDRTYAVYAAPRTSQSGGRGVRTAES